MQPAQGPTREQVALAARLRALREDLWPDVELTQAQLGRALGGDRPLSIAAISSWESLTSPRVPPAPRLTAYATFFATRRSIEGNVVRLLDDSELTKGERARRDELAGELRLLRAAALASPSGGPVLSAVKSGTAQSSVGTWRFLDGKPVTIVCAELPRELLDDMPDPDPLNPDHVDLYSYADLDALFELHGHIRAVNGPEAQVNVRLSPHLTADDYTTHLVLLGGVDWNELTRELLEQRLDVPVRQVSAEDRTQAYFEVTDTEQPVRYRPVVNEVRGGPVLLEDVAHFYRGPNPFNAKRTVTICNGMYARGTLGAVRTLTDARFRDRNEAHIVSRFAGCESFSILSRVLIVKGQTVTPDWTAPDVRLHEWPQAAA